MKKIFTLTVNPALDVYTTVEFLEPEKKLKCTPSTKDAGGGGVNVSRVLKRLGVEAGTIYTKGGYTGEIFGEILEKEGILQEPVNIKNDLRQNFAVSETSSGQLYRFGFPGAKLEDEEYKSIIEKIQQIPATGFLVASGSLPPNAPANFYSAIAKIAKEKNLKFVVDTSGQALCEILNEGAYLIKPNKDELENLCGKKATNDEERIQLLREVLANHPIEVIVLSMGPQGAILATKDKITRFPAPKVEFVSSIGAGDSMVAGIVYSLSLDRSLEEAVMFGLACGSATIKSPGTELLTRDDAESLYEALKKEVQISEM